MSLKDNILYALSFGTRKLPKKDNKPEANIQAEKLALRLIKSREKYRKLEKDATEVLGAYKKQIELTTMYLIASLIKFGGKVSIEKSVLDTIKGNMNKLTVNLNKIDDNETELVLVDMEKEIEEAQKAAESSTNEA